YVPKKRDSALPSTSAEVVKVEKNQQPDLIGTHEGNEEHKAEHQQNSRMILLLKIFKSMIRYCNKVTIDDVGGDTVMNKDLDQEAEEIYDNSSSVPDTQLVFVKQIDAVEVENPFTPVDIAVSATNDLDVFAHAIYT
ncbi:hypothetical protein L195_g039189, partial [Trifolium pratense]